MPTTAASRISVCGIGFPPAGGDPSHRYAIVFARPDNSERRYAVVDLTARKVVDVLDHLATRGAHDA